MGFASFSEITLDSSDSQGWIVDGRIQACAFYYTQHQEGPLERLEAGACRVLRSVNSLLVVSLCDTLCMGQASFLLLLEPGSDATLDFGTSSVFSVCKEWSFLVFLTYRLCSKSILEQLFLCLNYWIAFKSIFRIWIRLTVFRLFMEVQCGL